MLPVTPAGQREYDRLVHDAGVRTHGVALVLAAVVEAEPWRRGDTRAAYWRHIKRGEPSPAARAAHAVASRVAPWRAS